MHGNQGNLNIFIFPIFGPREKLL